MELLGFEHKQDSRHCIKANSLIGRIWMQKSSRRKKSESKCKIKHNM